MILIPVLLVLPTILLVILIGLEDNDECYAPQPAKKSLSPIVRKRKKNDLKDDNILIFDRPIKLGDIRNAFYDSEIKGRTCGNLEGLWFIVFYTQHEKRDQNLIVSGVNKKTFDLIIE